MQGRSTVTGELNIQTMTKKNRKKPNLFQQKAEEPK